MAFITITDEYPISLRSINPDRPAAPFPRTMDGRGSQPEVPGDLLEGRPHKRPFAAISDEIYEGKRVQNPAASRE
jgi:hypothetical protein